MAVLALISESELRLYRTRAVPQKDAKELISFRHYVGSLHYKMERIEGYLSSLARLRAVRTCFLPETISDEEFTFAAKENLQ